MADYASFFRKQLQAYGEYALNSFCPYRLVKSGRPEALVSNWGALALGFQAA